MLRHHPACHAGMVPIMQPHFFNRQGTVVEFYFIQQAGKISWRHRIRLFQLRVLMALALFVPTAGIQAARSDLFCASPWQEADLLFRRDPCWVGGDGAYSVDLGGGRFLWMFGDSVIDPSGSHSRKSPGVKMIGNSIAIQKGSDPSAATMRFFWKTAPDQSPAAFFPDSGKDRFWPGHGIRIRDRLLLFLMKVKSTPEGIGFEVCDWKAVLVQNPDDDPPDWKMSWLDTPSNTLQVIVGSAGVLSDHGFVYAHGSKEPGGERAFLVRWPESEAYNGNLAHIEWWDGHAWSDKEPSADNPAAVVINRAGSEFTVHRDPQSGKYLQIQCMGFGPADITMREAGRLVGPWSDPKKLYHPPEFDKPRIMIYQGKAHPGLTGADLVLTYSTNSFDFQNLINDGEIYYPRFVRLFFKSEEKTHLKKQVRNPFPKWAGVVDVEAAVPPSVFPACPVIREFSAS